MAAALGESVLTSNRLRQLRIERKMSGSAMGRFCGATSGVWLRWERGDSEPGVVSLRQIVRALDLPEVITVWLLMGSTTDTLESLRAGIKVREELEARMQTYRESPCKCSSQLGPDYCPVHAA